MILRSCCPWQGNEVWLVKLEGTGSPEDAALLRGARLLIRRSDRAPPADEDEFYVQVSAAAAPLTPPPTRTGGAPPAPIAQYKAQRRWSCLCGAILITASVAACQLWQRAVVTQHAWR